jgi:hypothetical protein
VADQSAASVCRQNNSVMCPGFSRRSRSYRWPGQKAPAPVFGGYRPHSHLLCSGGLRGRPVRGPASSHRRGLARQRSLQVAPPLKPGHIKSLQHSEVAIRSATLNFCRPVVVQRCPPSAPQVARSGQRGTVPLVAVLPDNFAPCMNRKLLGNNG